MKMVAAFGTFGNVEKKCKMAFRYDQFEYKFYLC